MKAKWCSYRYKGSASKWRFTKWRQHKTTVEMMTELRANKFGMVVVQVVINPQDTGTVEGNELWEWRPGRGWYKCPSSRRNWYRDSCDPNEPAGDTEDDIYGTVTRSIEPALALDGMCSGTEIPTDDQLANQFAS